MDRTTLPTVTNLAAAVHEDARSTVPYSPGLSVAGFEPFRQRKLQAKNEVSRARPPQRRQGREGRTKNRVLAKTGPSIRARAPKLWATPRFAPCSSGDELSEIMPKTGGRFRPEPMASSAR